MTAKAIAAMLHGRKFGRGYMCRCPCHVHAHGDRNRSLSVRESEDGWVMLKCFTGCSRDEILAAMGLQVRDLSLNNFTRNPEWEKLRADRDRLKVLRTREGAYIWLQALDPGMRSYWSAAERNIGVEIRQLADRIYSEKAALRKRNEETQRIIEEYGFDELWRCLP